MPSPLNCIRNSSICPAPLLRLLVQRDADQAVGRGHRTRREAGVFTLDVEVADLAEAEQPLVETAPVGHAAAVDVVRQVVDQPQAVALGMAVDAVDELEVDVVDALAVLEAVDQVQRRAADALDGRQAQFHRPGRDLHRLRAALQRQRVGLVRVAHAKGQATGAGAVFGGEVRGQAARLAVDDEVDASPWRYSSTSLLRWRATRLKPIFSNSGSSTPGVGDANSTNSKPIRPIGLSNRSGMAVLQAKGGGGKQLRIVGTRGRKVLATQVRA
jgi:hypothetical protein